MVLAETCWKAAFSGHQQLMTLSSYFVTSLQAGPRAEKAGTLLCLSNAAAPADMWSKQYYRLISWRELVLSIFVTIFKNYKEGWNLTFLLSYAEILQ